MQKIVVGIALALVIIAAGTYIVNQSDRSTAADTAQSTTQTSAPTATQTATGATAAETYTLADVAGHATQASCWTAINGKVYDVTSWISKHPGGARAILGLCGKDGSSAFNGQHGGQARPASELATFIIGTLSN